MKKDHTDIKNYFFSKQLYCLNPTAIAEKVKDKDVMQLFTGA